MTDGPTAPGIVDAHHHFWELGRFPYRWLAPDAPPRPFGDHGAIKRNYLPDDYRADFAGFRLEGSVHVQANCGADDPVAETAWLCDLSAATGLPSAAVAEADLSAPGAADTVARQAAHPLVRGVRAMVAWDPEGRWRFASRPGVLRDDAFRAGVRALLDHGLCLDLVVVPGQLPEVAELADAFPGLRIAINHLGQPEPARPGNADLWRQGLAALADRPDVFLKVSGLWTIDNGWNADSLRPFLAHALDTLGAGRMMYGSNLPVEKVNTGAARQVRVLQTLLADRSAAEVADLFAGTARRFYRL